MNSFELERRREPRSGVTTDVLVQVTSRRLWGLIGPRVENYGWLVNISTHGASVVYIDREMRPNQPVRITICPRDQYYSIADVLVKTVSDFKLTDLDNDRVMRQRSFQFSDLSAGQQGQLANLIRWIECKKSREGGNRIRLFDAAAAGPAAGQSVKGSHCGRLLSQTGPQHPLTPLLTADLLRQWSCWPRLSASVDRNGSAVHHRFDTPSQPLLENQTRRGKKEQ
jgi:hypothetical protein